MSGWWWLLIPGLPAVSITAGCLFGRALRTPDPWEQLARNNRREARR